MISTCIKQRKIKTLFITSICLFFNIHFISILRSIFTCLILVFLGFHYRLFWIYLVISKENQYCFFFFFFTIKRFLVFLMKVYAQMSPKWWDDELNVWSMKSQRVWGLGFEELDLASWKPSSSNFVFMKYLFYVWLSF